MAKKILLIVILIGLILANGCSNQETKNLNLTQFQLQSTTSENNTSEQNFKLTSINSVKLSESNYLDFLGLKKEEGMSVNRDFDEGVYHSGIRNHYIDRVDVFTFKDYKGSRYFWAIILSETYYLNTTKIMLDQINYTGFGTLKNITLLDSDFGDESKEAVHIENYTETDGYWEIRKEVFISFRKCNYWAEIYFMSENSHVNETKVAEDTARELEKKIKC